MAPSSGAVAAVVVVPAAAVTRLSVRGWWVAVFLAVTAVAIALELVAALWTGPAIAPWTDLLSHWVPAPVTMVAVAVLCVWLPVHMVNALRRARRTPDVE